MIAALPDVISRTPFGNPHLAKDLTDLFSGMIDVNLADVIKAASTHREALLRGDGQIRMPDAPMPPAAPPPEIERQIIYVHQHSKWMEFGEAKTAPNGVNNDLPPRPELYVDIENAPEAATAKPTIGIETIGATIEGTATL